MALIQARNLTKIYRDNGVETLGLDGIDLDINDGEFVAIVGPSGSGKSTLLQMLGCLDRPTSGTYHFNGTDVMTATDKELAYIRNRDMGFVFQAFNLLPRQTVLDNIKLPLIYAGISEPERTARSAKFVDMVGLADRQDYKAAKLSGGQKQRVAIARALINEPKVIFADEPTGSLDSKSGEVVLEFLQKLNDEGHTIVLVTHESYVAESAKRIVHVRDGKIEKDEQVTERRIIADHGFTK